MRIRYTGESFGVDSLTNGKTYKCIAVEGDGRFLRIVDDSGEDYLYSAKSPGSLDEPDKCGVWEVVEDSEDGTLQKLLGAKVEQFVS